LWTTSDSKIVQNFKNMCKNLLVLNLTNEGDDLILYTDAAISTRVQYSKSKREKKIYKYYS